MLTKAEFDILILIKNSDNKLTQRLIATGVEISLGKANQLLAKLTDEELIVSDNHTYKITDAGIKALEPHRVNNAIIMAAGMSSRFVPLSYEKPKGLLNVKGDILIEREIRQLQEAGINDITIVVGYMKEKFFYLEDKYNVKIVINQDYHRYNNTSTLIRVLDELKNTYICSSDNYFVENVFEPYVYRAYYSAVYGEGETAEYCLSCNNKGEITNVTIGGSDSWYMLGHVYFDKQFSDSFKSILSSEWDNPITKESLWENIYMKHIKELHMFIRKYDIKKVLEFDSLEELRAFDNEYINNVDSSIMRNISKVLECDIKDIVNIKAIKSGLTNTSFSFSVNGIKYVYRHPGVDTEKYINRKSEALSMSYAKELGLDNTFIYMDENEGWKISLFVDNTRDMDYKNEAEVNHAIEQIKKLHNVSLDECNDKSIWDLTETLIDSLPNDKKDISGFAELKNKIKSLFELTEKDEAKKVLCHGDFCATNILVSKDSFDLIDWEYSRFDDPANDIGTFICCSDYSYDEAVKIITKYLNSDDTKLIRHYIAYIALCSFYWYIWALYKESQGNVLGQDLFKWYKKSNKYFDKAKELYEG